MSIAPCWNYPLIMIDNILGMQRADSHISLWKFRLEQRRVVGSTLTNSITISLIKPKFWQGCVTGSTPLTTCMPPSIEESKIPVEVFFFPVSDGACCVFKGMKTETYKTSSWCLADLLICKEGSRRLSLYTEISWRLKQTIIHYQPYKAQTGVCQTQTRTKFDHVHLMTVADKVSVFTITVTVSVTKSTVLTTSMKDAEHRSPWLGPIGQTPFLPSITCISWLLHTKLDRFHHVTIQKCCQSQSRSRSRSRSRPRIIYLDIQFCERQSKWSRGHEVCTVIVYTPWW